MKNDPHPKDFNSRKEYIDACVTEEDYGVCNPIKSKIADEKADDAGERWDDWNGD